MSDIGDRIDASLSEVNARLDQATRERNEIKDRLDAIEVKLATMGSKLETGSGAITSKIEALRANLPDIIRDAMRDALDRENG